MTSLPGYFQQYLRIDLSTRECRTVPIPAEVLRRFLGGAGLGTWILLRETPRNLDPLSPEAPLAFIFSPLVGSPLTTSAKFAVMAKSPLTHRINDSLSSSHFAIAGKRTGYDALVIVGQAEQPLCLVITPEEVHWEPAADVWGQSSSNAEQQLRQRLGNEFQIASIGIAGENQVRYATVSHDGRHAGRGGLGAVMGSKNLKAVAVSGDRRTEFAHREELVRYSREVSKLSFGPATAKYRELGTVSNLLTFNRLGTLPTRNFQEGTFEQAEALAPETITLTHERTRSSCAACTIGCEHIFRRSDGKSGVRMEYENLFALGPLCGISDPDVVLEASALCDEYGLDTISAGATIAFAMECAERGFLDQPQLRFGNGDALLEMLSQIAHREGIGEFLANGSRAAAEEIGQGTDRFAPHVKGLELPGYEPRAVQTMALGFAVGTRGADHNRSGAYQVDFSEGVDRLHATEQAIPAAIQTEDEAALMDSLILCKFLRGVFPDRLEAMSRMLHLITGWEITPAELQETARRIVTARKWYNIQQGWTPAEDTLPERFLAEPLAKGTSAGARLSREQLRRLIQTYNLARGWSPEGWIADDLVLRFQIE